MIKIKIVSDPYNRSISYHYFQEQKNEWTDIEDVSINSRLREKDKEKIFLPFMAKEIVDIIISEYYVGTEKIELVFQGTTDEYEEMITVCSEPEIADKVHLTRSTRTLDNARDILDHTKETFGIVEPIIKTIVKDDPDITKSLDKVSDALKDIIPICIFGNYSAGKSTFINSLIGYEILPSGGDPVTSKIYEIKRSDHEDRARIEFSYLENEYELLFDKKECHVTRGDSNCDLIQEILNRISNIDDLSLFHMVNTTIDTLNYYEKRDRKTTLISNVIEIEVPFSESGKLGQSRNDYVIFDTPGSNSNTNMNHKEVLANALEGFSNGIPVWVSAYDSIDSVDNANLCDELYKIEALDKRFTMIVVNKADSVELPKNGLDHEEINDIMEYESVKQMYSSGIYFVSSVMGLGAKNRDGIVSDYLLDVFEEKERKFSDPEARSYKKLYEYNIMPEQIKKRAMKLSEDYDNLIYANSGLLCVEMEMEQFASKHAAYNKCQMVYMFLRSIINETGRRISYKTEILEKSKKKREQELDQKKYALVESVEKDTKETMKRFERESKLFVLSLVKESVNEYNYSAEQLEQSDQTMTEQNEQDKNYTFYENDFIEAKRSKWKNLAENTQNIFKGNIIDSLKNMATEWASDSKFQKEKKERMDSARQDIDKETSDNLFHMVVKQFKRTIVDAQEKLTEASKRYWQERAQEYKESMIRLIVGTDALSEKQRGDLSQIILSYAEFQYNDDTDRVFIKAKFLRGNVLGIRLSISERLNTRRLSSRYNMQMKKNMEEMSDLINSSCFASFMEWEEKLKNLIIDNITSYNPELRELTEYINEESDRILELQTNQQTITNSFRTIEDMMAWKELE